MAKVTALAAKETRRAAPQPIHAPAAAEPIFPPANKDKDLSCQPSISEANPHRLVNPWVLIDPFSRAPDEDKDIGCQPSITSLCAASKSTHDQRMASRQTQITTLPPADRQQQEEWAQAQLRTNAGACIAGWSWVRTENSGGLSGYRCQGRSHFVTDELLARGKATCYMRDMTLYEIYKQTR
ncbi:hypothetical protein LSUB1_G001779 [Lachnellula subtilissima]|uniref:Uncharacterized protein n=1 Tax=Lachnellula subtilissima TaxID=602034 RepID=A0A8H8UH83_9HELO|nr:hypothetical protein LSUB1_G001779 [Lachnellula subtilissima]